MRCGKVYDDRCNQERERHKGYLQSTPKKLRDSDTCWLILFERMDGVPHIYASKLNGTVHIYSVAYYCRDAIA